MNCDHESGGMLKVPFPCGSQQPVRLHTPLQQPARSLGGTLWAREESPRRVHVKCEERLRLRRRCPPGVADVVACVATRSVNVNKCQVGFISFIVSPPWQGLA